MPYVVDPLDTVYSGKLPALGESFKLQGSAGGPGRVKWGEHAGVVEKEPLSENSMFTFSCLFAETWDGRGRCVRDFRPPLSGCPS